MPVKLAYWFVFYFFLSGIVMAQHAFPDQLQKTNCQRDTTQQYALFVPKGYNPENPATLLIFLDPMGSGDVPVEMYSSLANEFSIVMAGSYNSKNFNSATSVESFVAIYNDLVKRYTIDPERIWVAGFSGGARAGAAIATTYGEIKGVIGCGAGFASDEQIITNKKQAYAAVVGTGDMNYSELLDNSHYLDEKKISNLLLTFDGGHQWPPVEQLGLAIEWLQSQVDPIPSLPTVRGLRFIETVCTKYRSGLLYEAWMDVNQFCKLPAYKIKSDSLRQEIEKSKQFNTDKEKFDQVIMEEQNYINDFSIAFSRVIEQNVTVEKTTWLEKIKLIAQMKNSENHYRQMAGQRCFDHYVRLCLEYYFLNMSLKNYELAYKIARISSLIKPTDSDSYYYLAVSLAALGNKKQSLKCLIEAIKMGLTYSSRIWQDQHLLTIFSAEELERVFAKK
jgi:predicted esterase